jgi:hypothetical protein
MKKKRGRKSKQQTDNFNTKEGVLKFVDDMFDNKTSASNSSDTKQSAKIIDIRKFAQEKSKGATGGALKQLDPIIRKISGDSKKTDSDTIAIKKNINDNASSIRRVSSSVSILETRVGDLTEQSNKTLGMLGDLISEFNKFKNETSKQFEKISKQSDSSSGGILGTISDLTSGIQNNKSKANAAKAPAKTVSTANSALKSVSSAAKLGLKTLPGVGGLVSGVAEYMEGGELGRSIAAGAGTILGGILGGVLGSALGPVGTAAGGLAGSMAGEELAKSGYDWIFGKKKPAESDAIKKSREDREKPSDSKSGTSVSSPSPGMTPGVTTTTAGNGLSGDKSQPQLKGIGETGNATEAINYFTQNGWTREQAAGIVGNLQAESGPNMKTDSIGDGGKAYGIAQWHPDRQAVFKKVYNKDIREAGFKEQLAYVNWELNNTEIAAGRALRAAKTAEEAADLINRLYERSADKTGQRAANAIALIKNNQQAVSPTAAPEGTSAPNAVPVETGVATPGETFVKPVAGNAPVTGSDSSTTSTQGINKGIAEKISSIESSFGKLSVTSGYRDQKKNDAVGGAKNSAHTRANAVDVTFSGDEVKTLKLVEIASKAGIGGIGVYKPGVVHLDTESRRVWGPDFTQNSIPKWAAGALQAHMTGQWGQYDATAAGTKANISETGNTNTTSPGRSTTSFEGSTAGLSGMNFKGMGATSQGMSSGSIQTSKAQIPGPLGMVTRTPGIGQMAGLISTVSTGGSLIPKSPMDMIGMFGSILNAISSGKNNNVRAPNPTFTPDAYQNNNVPPALPSQQILSELFDMKNAPDYNPGG